MLTHHSTSIVNWKILFLVRFPKWNRYFLHQTKAIIPLFKFKVAIISSFLFIPQMHNCYSAAKLWSRLTDTRQMTEIRPTVDLHVWNADNWPTYPRHTNHTGSRCLHNISTDTQPTVCHYIVRLSTDYRPSIGQFSADHRPNTYQLSADVSIDYRPTINHWIYRETT